MQNVGNPSQRVRRSSSAHSESSDGVLVAPIIGDDFIVGAAAHRSSGELSSAIRSSEVSIADTGSASGSGIPVDASALSSGNTMSNVQRHIGFVQSAWNAARKNGRYLEGDYSPYDKSQLGSVRSIVDTRTPTDVGVGIKDDHGRTKYEVSRVQAVDVGVYHCRVEILGDHASPSYVVHYPGKIPEQVTSEEGLMFYTDDVRATVRANDIPKLLLKSVFDTMMSDDFIGTLFANYMPEAHASLSCLDEDIRQRFFFTFYTQKLRIASCSTLRMELGRIVDNARSEMIEAMKWTQQRVKKVLCDVCGYEVNPIGHGARCKNPDNSNSLRQCDVLVGSALVALDMRVRVLYYDVLATERVEVINSVLSKVSIVQYLRSHDYLDMMDDRPLTLLASDFYQLYYGEFRELFLARVSAAWESEYGLSEDEDIISTESFRFVKSLVDPDSDDDEDADMD